MASDEANAHRLIGVIQQILKNNEGLSAAELSVFWGSFIQFWDDYISGDVMLDDNRIIHIRRIQE